MGAFLNVIGCECEKKNNHDDSMVKFEDGFTEFTEEKKNVSTLKIKTRDFVRQINDDVFNIYEKINLLGEGSFGSVYSVRRKGTNTIRALKIIHKNLIFDEKNIKNEINILKEIDHPNIMKIFEFYEDEDNFYIIAEYCDCGDLKTIIQNTNSNNNFPEFLLKYIMYQVFTGISFLHNNNVVHSDLKEENVAFVNIKNSNETFNIKNNIFTKIINNKKIEKELNECNHKKDLSTEASELINELCNYEVKILDFGAAKFNTKNSKLKGITGTDYYCSPEIIKEQYSFNCDEWACGVMMYFVLSGGIPPFPGESEDEIFENVMNKEVDLSILKNASENCKDLISKLLVKDPEGRITATQALKHDFFKKGLKIEKLLKGKKKENAELIESYASTKLKNIEEKRKEKFKDAVIAYIVFKFIDKDEEKKITKVFRELSGQNNNYLITKKTFCNYMKKNFKSFNDSEIMRLYNEIDQNGSGNLEYEELMRALCDKKKLLSEKNLKDAFNFFDDDKNGLISLDEVAGIIYEGKTMPKDIINDILEEFGKDKNDTNINYEEFIKILKN